MATNTSEFACDFIAAFEEILSRRYAELAVLLRCIICVATK